MQAGIKAKQRLNKIRKLEQQDNLILNNQRFPSQNSEDFYIEQSDDLDKEDSVQQENNLRKSRISGKILQHSFNKLEIGLDYFMDSADISREQVELMDQIFKDINRP